MRENTDQNNSEYEPFSRSVYFQVFFQFTKRFWNFWMLLLLNVPIQEKKI